MSPNPVTVGRRVNAAEVREELLGRLGLRASASDQDVEAAHNGLVEFLELAPHEMKSWAQAQTVDVDKAFALLSGPEQDLVDETQTAALAQEAPVTHSKPTAPAPPAGPGALATAKSRRNMYAAAIVAVIIVVIFGVWYMGRDSSGVPGISGTPTNGATTAAAQPTAAPLDQAKVGALMQKIATNAKDLVSLAGLGDLVLTCTDDQSRNRRMGLALAKGKSLADAQKEIRQVVEGVRAAPEVMRLAVKHGVDMPISTQVSRVLAGEITPVDAVRYLATRPPRAENE